MYRRRAIPKRAVCSTGLAQSQACSGCYKQWEAEFGVRITCVRMRCKDLGEDGQLCVVLLGWAALLSWHSIVSGWWSSRQQRCKDACGGTESCGEDCIRLCVLCTQSALGRTGFRRHRRRDRRACCRCGRPGLPRAQEGQSKIFEDGKCVGSGGACGNISSWSLLLQHFIFYSDIAIVCCWAICGLSTCAIYRQGSTWTNTAPTRFNVGLLVEAGDGGGGALVPGSGSWTLFLFFSALWGKATSR